MKALLTLILVAASLATMSCGRKADRDDRGMFSSPASEGGDNNQVAGGSPSDNPSNNPGTNPDGTVIQLSAFDTYLNCTGLSQQETDSEQELSLSEVNDLCAALSKSGFLAGINESSEASEI